MFLPFVLTVIASILISLIIGIFIGKFLRKKFAEKSVELANNYSIEKFYDANRRIFDEYKL